MDTRPLAVTGPELSVFGLGTMTFGAEADESTSHALLDAYVGAGGSLIDTADVYSAGVSEQIIGTWLAGRSDREALVIATKARFSMGRGLAGAGADYLGRAVDASLDRLGVEVIDLYQIHAWDPATPIEETMGALDGLVRAGKVRAIGVSNFTGWQLQRALSIAKYEDLAPIASLQPQYSLLGREIELEILPLCLDAGVGVLAWSPLAGGWLTGKYAPDERPSGDSRLGDDPDRGIEAYDLRNQPRTWRVIDVVRRIATARGVSAAQVALNWVRQRPGVTSVLLGARTVSQLEDNMAAAAWSLTDDEMSELTAVSAPGIPIYPHAFLEAYAGVDVWQDLGTRIELPPIGR